MKQRNETWHAGEDWPSALDEIRRFLETWYYAVSSMGHVYVEPHRDQIEIESLRFFLNRLRLMREPGFPRSVTFDFTKVTFIDAPWEVVMDELDHYASDMGASLMPCGDDGGPRKLIYLHRQLTIEPELLITRN